MSLNVSLLASRLSGRLNCRTPRVATYARASFQRSAFTSKDFGICLGTCAGAGLFFHSNIAGTTASVQCYQVPQSAKNAKLHVVLDIDETLVKAQITESQAASASTQGWTKTSQGFVLHIPEGYAITVVKRPGMDEFMQWLKAQGFEVSLYSAGTRFYVEALLPLLDPSGCISPKCVLCREDCIPTETQPNQYLKDLSRVRSAAAGPDGNHCPVNLARTILVDNNPVSFTMQPSNGILVSDWLGSDPDDDEFERVKAQILELERSAPGCDVRTAIPRLKTRRQVPRLAL